MTGQSFRPYTDSVQYLPSLGVSIDLMTEVRQNEGCGCSCGGGGCDLYVKNLKSKINYRRKGR